jgi:membrane-associated protein
MNLLDFILHIDKHLEYVFQEYGALVNALLFIIVFCETGLVITPFLPGDSLLFAAGALAASGGLNVHFLVALLIVAAILGDGVNYLVGATLGEKASLKYPKIFRKSYLEKTHSFYKKYGGKTIIFARFVPIVRTFAPFLAGVGTMKYRQFLLYNIVGGVAWVTLFTYAGYIFGNIPVIKKNFSLVILGIIIVSALPIVFEYFKAKKEQKALSS